MARLEANSIQILSHDPGLIPCVISDNGRIAGVFRRSRSGYFWICDDGAPRELAVEKHLPPFDGLRLLAIDHLGRLLACFYQRPSQSGVFLFDPDRERLTMVGHCENTRLCLVGHVNRRGDVAVTALLPENLDDKVHVRFFGHDGRTRSLADSSALDLGEDGSVAGFTLLGGKNPAARLWPSEGHPVDLSTELPGHWSRALRFTAGGVLCSITDPNGEQRYAFISRGSGSGSRRTDPSGL